MFICSGCLEKDYNNLTTITMGSYGKCEGCGELSACADIPSYTLIKKGVIDPEVGLRLEYRETWARRMDAELENNGINVKEGKFTHDSVDASNNPNRRWRSNNCKLEAKQSNNMEKQIKMSLETARSAYKVLMNTEKFTIVETVLSTLLLENFTKEELEGDKGFSWEDSFSKEGWYIHNMADIRECNCVLAANETKNIFKTEAQTKSALAFAQLSHIVDRYNQGKTGGSAAYAISIALSQGVDNPLYVRKVQYVSNIAHLQFLTEQDAETSLRVNRQLWLDYWMINNI